MKQSIDKIFAWFNSLSTFIKVLSSLIVIGTWGVAGVTTYNNWIIKKHDSMITIDLKQVNEKLGTITENANTMNNSINTISSNQSIISGQIEDVKTKVSDLSEGVDVLNRKVETQIRAMSNHFQKENMLDDRFNFLQELYEDQKKKNGLIRAGGV